MWNAELDESEAGINLDGRNISNLRYADVTTLMEECGEELTMMRMILDEDERGEWKSRLETQHSKN